MYSPFFACKVYIYLYLFKVIWYSKQEDMLPGFDSYSFMYVNYDVIISHCFNF